MSRNRINRPAVIGMTRLTVRNNRQVGMTLLAVGRRRHCFVMEGGRFASMTRLAIIILTGQATSMAIGTGQSSTFDPYHIMVLSFGRASATGSRPESIIVTGGAGLWCKSIVAINTISDRSRTKHDIVMLSHSGIATG
jgi:hypothetical protein